MAKNIYVVTFVDGTVENFTNKKAIKAVKANVANVTTNGTDITSEFIKVVPTVAADVVEVAETVKTETVETVANESRATLLFTASRGSNKSLTWRQVVVKPNEELVKVKGCAALLPVSVAEAIGTDKFVSWIDQDRIEQAVGEYKQLRGMASTFSDVFTRFCKVNDITGADKLTTVLELFSIILHNISDGNTTGGWEHAEEVEAA